VADASYVLPGTLIGKNLALHSGAVPRWNGACVRVDWRSKTSLLRVAAILVGVGVLLIAIPFVVLAVVAHTGKPASPAVLGANLVNNGMKDATSSVAATGAAGAAQSSAASAAVLSSATPAPGVSSVGTTATPTPSLDAYKGLGMWVDIYDDSAWKDPRAAVADMARHGARTLFLETSNSRSSFDLKDPSKVELFVSAAHARGMKVVAWYLPDFKKPSVDYRRVSKAINYRTSDGQKFDSFALDIESDAVKSERSRNKALESLSAKIRDLAGASYPLGAIIPSPTGLAKSKGYWSTFPYAALARRYDVFVPMSYYTYHGKTASAAYADTKSNIRILRAQKGCANTPIHLIGGIAEKSSASEAKQFARAAMEGHCIGASFYSWPGTSAAHWKALSAIKP
jgi:hypothetical protein